MSSPAELRLRFLSALNATALSSRPYHNQKWRLNSDESIHDTDELSTSVRLYYLSRYLNASQIPGLIANVPYICTGGDYHIITQDQVPQWNLDVARRHFPSLISNEERRISRSKCVASVVKVYAIGGYNSPFNALSKQDFFSCIIISGAGPQFEATYLDYQDFMIVKNEPTGRLLQFSHFGDLPPSWDDALKATELGDDFIRIGRGADAILHAKGYLVSMSECMHLWLQAFNDMVGMFGQGKKGYMKITAIGTGFFADLANSLGVNIGEVIMPLLLKAVRNALSSHTYEHITALEFPDFSGRGLFTPEVLHANGVRLIAAPYKDVLDFEYEVKREFCVGLLNPGDCFACVGNELGYGSVEAMIGNNTTIRSTQCYIWNENILDECNIISVSE